MHAGLGDFGTHALNVLRQEKGFKMWGAEMNMDTTIVDAGLVNFVNMKKVNFFFSLFFQGTQTRNLGWGTIFFKPFFSFQGDFVGRAALEDLLRHRPRRHLVQVKIDSEDVDPHVSSNWTFL